MRLHCPGNGISWPRFSLNLQIREVLPLTDHLHRQNEAIWRKSLNAVLFRKSIPRLLLQRNVLSIKFAHVSTWTHLQQKLFTQWKLFWRHVVKCIPRQFLHRLKNGTNACKPTTTNSTDPIFQRLSTITNTALNPWLGLLTPKQSKYLLLGYLDYNIDTRPGSPQTDQLLCLIFYAGSKKHRYFNAFVLIGNSLDQNKTLGS